MAEFAKGDVVVLKSGGPKMTVTDIGDYSPLGSKDGVKCVWFEKTKGSQEHREEVFDAAVLEKYTPRTSTIRLRRG